MFAVTLDGLPGHTLKAPGDAATAGPLPLMSPPIRCATLRVLVTAPAGAVPGRASRSLSRSSRARSRLGKALCVPRRRRGSPMTGAVRRRGFRLTGWHVLVAFVLFFGVDIAINTVFMVVRPTGPFRARRR